MTADIADQASGEVSETSSDHVEEPQQELIEANDVLKALKSFVVENNKHRVRQVALCLLPTTRVAGVRRSSARVCVCPQHNSKTNDSSK